MGEAVEFNPFLPEFRADPYPMYHRLRVEDPVHRSTLMEDTWIVARYADGAAVLHDRRFGWEGAQELLLDRLGPGPIQRVRSKWMLFMDPPDHTRLRTLVNKAFTPRVVEAMRPHIREIVDELLGAVEGAGRMDVIADFAYPLPVIVICEMLGVPTEDRETFKGWSRDLARTLDPAVSPELIEQTREAALAFQEYFTALIAERRARPRDDLISALIAAEEQGDRLSEEELLATLLLLFGAGHETTMNLIGNGTLALLRHPDQLERLRGEPALAVSAVEELLRYDGPVQLAGRIAGEDVEIRGKPIRKGEIVVPLLGAANRDPAQFPDPDRLDLTRTDIRHLTFGGGVHFCLGAPLARVEGQIAITTLLRRLPGLKLETDVPEWRETVTLRGLKALPVAF